ncbi:LPXTG cell wall anchor domain-containing protein [Actinosynnema sp. NPDC091369]
MVVVVCLALGLAVAPGVALADPSWHVPDGWGDQGRGDVCRHRGDPPCHTTTTNPTTTSTGGWSTSVTTTTTAVSGTSATSTSTSTTTTAVAGTTTASTTTTSAAGTTVPKTTTAALAVTTTVPPRVVSASSGQVLADTGAAPLWTGVGGLAALLAGASLLLVSRRRRA